MSIKNFSDYLTAQIKYLVGAGWVKDLAESVWQDPMRDGKHYYLQDAAKIQFDRDKKLHS
jgi:adenosine deaminase